MRTPFHIADVIWARPNTGLPTTAIIDLPNYLVLSGPEDYDEEALSEADELDEDEIDDFWDAYEPSKAARRA